MIDRLGSGFAVPLIDPEAPNDGWQERGRALAIAAQGKRVVLVGHGLAVPAVIAAAEAGEFEAVVLSNGPVTRLDPITAFVARLARAPGFSETLLRPGIWLRWLRSSAGLRRAVVNPYVMDRDTTAALAGPLIANAASRSALAAYLASLSGPLPDPRFIATRLWTIWGDGDPAYPAYEADYAISKSPAGRHRCVPGGQHFHPEERPWAMADLLAAVMAECGGDAQTLTSVS